MQNSCIEMRVQESFYQNINFTSITNLWVAY